MILSPEDTLLAGLRARLPQIDNHLHGPHPDPLPTASSETIAATELEMGLELPPLLKRVYSEIGNGGFGPGYGLLGIGDQGFPDDQGQSASALYLEFRKIAKRCTKTFTWPEGLIPICSLGCAMYECVDTVQGEMVLWEPNLWDDRQSVFTALFHMNLDLFQWFEHWANGTKPQMPPAPPGKEWPYGYLPFADPVTKSAGRHTHDPRQRNLFDDF